MIPRRNSLPGRIITCLLLILMAINPALAMQYNHMPPVSDHSTDIPGDIPTVLRIHASQEQELLNRLAKQGYRVIPASRDEVNHFLASQTPSAIPPYELAATYKPQPGDASDCDKATSTGQTDCEKPPPPEEETATPPTPKTRATISHTGGIDLPNTNSGGGGDTAKVMLILIGVVVIAALIVYAGKFIVDMVSDEDDYYAYWWDIGTRFVTLDTEADQHGDFTGLTFGVGFIAGRLVHFGLTAEVGKMDLDLLYNRNTTPQRITLQGAYWLIGPTVRFTLGNVDTENVFNNSYVYFELLGGSSDRKEIDVAAVGRLGFNTGIGEHMRLGIHYGALYLGLDESQGIIDKGDNYWNMFGLEVGYQF